MRILIGDRNKGLDNYIAALSHFPEAELIFLREDRKAEGLPECDALLLPGGDDIDPALFGQAWNGTRDVDRALDDAQIALTQHYAEEKKPILGICRGAQVINVAFGGDLIQDLPEPQNSHHTWYHDENGKTMGHHHLTAIRPGTFLEELYGSRIVTNSYHHQAIGRLAAGFSVLQESDDGVIEFAAHDSLPICAVQWHPEKEAFETAKKGELDSVGNDNGVGNANFVGIADGGVLFTWFLEKIRVSMAEKR